jgi:hypothetical protein
MIDLFISLALVADAPASSQTEQGLSYEYLLDCYGSFMVSKGLDMESPERLLVKWDAAARRKCASEIRKHKSLVGSKQFEQDWDGLWGEWRARV